MFDTKKFGLYLARLRKGADMTQSDLAERLSVTRQAVSGYERGDSFPDVTILVMIADIFSVSVDDMIASGEPTRGEAVILGSAAAGRVDPLAGSVSDIVNLAPLLKPSVLAVLAEGLGKQGIDISNIVALAEYLNDDSVRKLLGTASFDACDEKLLTRLMPLLDERSRNTVMEKILNGELDWHLLAELIPYSLEMASQVEAAVVEGALPWDALDIMHEGMGRAFEMQRIDGE